MSLLFNMLSRFVIAFLPRSKCLLISWLQSPLLNGFGAQENKICHCFHFFPFYLPWSYGTGWHDLSFWMLNFKPAFSLSSFTLIKWLFCSSSLCTIRIASSACVRLLTFLLAILIPACDSFGLAFCMMHSAYKLNKEGNNIQPSHTPFPILSQSVLPHKVLTVASWPTYWIFRRQVWWSGTRISFKNFPVCFDPHNERL